MDSTNQEQCGTAVFTIDKSAYKWILAVQTPAVQGLSGFMQKKKKNPLEILPMIGFLAVAYDPILSMFGHSNLIIWVLPLFLYIITFLFSKYYIDKSVNTHLFRLLSPCCNYE